MGNINLIIAWAAAILAGAMFLVGAIGLIYHLIVRNSQPEKASSSDAPFMFEAEGYTEGATDDFSSNFLQDKESEDPENHPG